MVVGKGHRRSMRCRLGVGERMVGQSQSLVDSPEHPQRNRIKCFRSGAGILSEAVGEIAVACLIVEFDSLPKMVMSAGKVAEINAGGAGNAVRDQGLGAIRPGRGFVQEKLGHFARRCRFAANMMPDPNTVIGGKSLRRVFHLARQFAGAREGRARVRRVISLGPDQRIAEAGLQVQPVDARRGSRRRRGDFVGQLDRLGEMGGGFLEGGAADRLVAGFAPPFDRRLVEPGLG